MGVISFLKTNCENCYSCVRACSVNAIKVLNDQAQIMEDRCIACGKCIKACPKNAKEIKSDIETVEGFIERKEKIMVSLAPSFLAAFGSDGMKVFDGLKRLGITNVEETSLGANKVNKEFEKYVKMIDGKCYITSCCASLNELIQKHYPELIENLIPVITPMECHGRMLKSKYGEEIKVVFIGPCIAKKSEGENENSIDGVLTFEELKILFEKNNINLEECKEWADCNSNNNQRNYPILGGITIGMNKEGIKRDLLHVDGLEECVEVLREIAKGRFKDTFIEMNLCRHGCINGPAIPENGLIVYERRQLIKKFALKENGGEQIFENLVVEMKKEFISQYKPLYTPTESEIKQILGATGKHSKKDELNCGTCGYKTCKEKAIAVYNGMAELNMCLPYMKQKAENMSNIIFEITPTIIMVINKEAEIVDLNPSAEEFFKIKKSWIKGVEVKNLLELDYIEKFILDQTKTLSRKEYLKREGATVIVNLIKIENSDRILIVINDFTESLRQEEERQTMKINAIDMAQHVIDKQMRVAQEIASLLGETTAETKVYLTKLKKIVQGDER